MMLETNVDYNSLKEFFIENGLEYDDGKVDDRIVCSWQIREGPKQSIVAGALLIKSKGEFILDGIAVSQSCRKNRKGSLLLGEVIKKVRQMGGRRIYLTAKVPDFFRKAGFETISFQDGPDYFDCLSCPQYGKKCRPEVMVLEVENENNS
jgi:N-acetylglutamate synthase-like GNAT family acetyltransferase